MPLGGVSCLTAEGLGVRRLVALNKDARIESLFFNTVLAELGDEVL